MIKVLIVEDSLAMKALLRQAISSDPMLTVVGVASDGEALEAVEKHHPDVIAMGCRSPNLGRQETTLRIMETMPTPIVVVTESVPANDAAASFRMIEAGALAMVQQPASGDQPGDKRLIQQLTRALTLMSEVKLVRRTARSSAVQRTASLPVGTFFQAESDIQIVAIGASTGGPNALQQILSGLPKQFPVPLFIVQHISRGFTAGFVEWLQETTGFPLQIASHGTYALRGQAYVAPDGCHMEIERGPRIALNHHGLHSGLRPSVACMFRSAAHNFNANAVGVLLSGMGRDGADELKMMKDKGAVTIAQNKESSIIHGMPGEAIKLNAATYILSPDGIAVALAALIMKNESVTV